MPSIETDLREQDAVLWPCIGYDSEGQARVSNKSIQLKVRWEEYRTESLDAKGNKIALDVMVVVDRVIPIGSVMWLGTKAQIPGTSLVPTSDLFEVKVRGDIPDIKNRNRRRTVGLMRLNDVLPI